MEDYFGVTEVTLICTHVITGVYDMNITTFGIQMGEYGPLAECNG